MNALRVGLIAVSAFLICVTSGNVLGHDVIVGSESRCSPMELGERIAEAPEFGEVALSPNGEWLVYEVVSKSIASNQIERLAWLRNVSPDGSNAAPMHQLPKGAHNFRWLPKGERLSFMMPSDGPGEGFKISIVNAVDGKILDIFGEKNGVPVGVDYQWSPSGEFIAFTRSISNLDLVPLNERHGVPYNARRSVSRYYSPSSLFVLDVATGRVRRLTKDGTSVTGFSWSPDDKKLAVTIEAEEFSQNVSSDLIVVDRVTGSSRDLVVRSGEDADPQWSPDGQWIAFATDSGEPDYFPGRPAIVDASGGRPVVFSGLLRGGGYKWMPDSSGFIYEAEWRGGRVLSYVDVSHRSPERLDPLYVDDTSPYVSKRSFSADMSRMAFVRSTPIDPGELVVADINQYGEPVDPVRQVVSLEMGTKLESSVRWDVVDWKSRDGKFTIYGVLITPTRAWKEGKIFEPLPVLLSIRGGPSMVTKEFGSDGWGGVEIAAAERGYAVLAPNTRGRGGAGNAFRSAIAMSRSYVDIPLQDALDGIEYLDRLGVVNSGKAGIIGHSYGASIVEFAVSQSDTFKSAVMYEGGLASVVDKLYPYPKNSWKRVFARDYLGIHNIFDPEERAVFLEQLGGFVGEGGRTPTMLLFGGWAESVGAPFFNALQNHDVPSAFFVYHEGHAIERPAAAADAIARTLEWLDYWIREIPYPNPDRATEYNEWRSWRKKTG